MLINKLVQDNINSFIQFYYYQLINNITSFIYLHEMKQSIRRTSSSTFTTTKLSKRNRQLQSIYSPQNKKQQKSRHKAKVGKKQSNSSNNSINNNSSAAKSYSQLIRSHFDLSRSQNAKFRSSKSIRKRQQIQNQEQEQGDDNLIKSEFFTTMPITISNALRQKQTKQQQSKAKKLQILKTVKQVFAQKASLCSNLVHQVQQNFFQQRLLKGKIQQLKKAIAHQRKVKSKVSIRLNKILNSNQHQLKQIRDLQNQELDVVHEINLTQKEVDFLDRQNHRLSQKHQKNAQELEKMGQIVEELKKTVNQKKSSLDQEKKNISELKSTIKINTNYFKNLNNNHQILGSTKQNILSSVDFSDHSSLYSRKNNTNQNVNNKKASKQQQKR